MLFIIYIIPTTTTLVLTTSSRAILILLQQHALRIQWAPDLWNWNEHSGNLIHWDYDETQDARANSVILGILLVVAVYVMLIP